MENDKHTQRKAPTLWSLQLCRPDNSGTKSEPMSTLWCEHRMEAFPKFKTQQDASPNSTVCEEENFLRARTQSDKRNNLTSYFFESNVPTRIERG